MLIDRLIVQETQALQAAKADPTALERYREYYNRRRALQEALSHSQPD
jgi:DNA primase